MKLFKQTCAALAVSAISLSAWADSVAITNATVYTMSEQGILNNATVVVEDGQILAVNPDTVSADTTIDAAGKILTPGFIATMSGLGLVEVSAVASSRDASDDKADITFDPSLAFNPKTTVIPFSRKGGVTSSVVAPRGGKDIFAGQTFVVDLSGEHDSILAANNAVVVNLGAKSKGSRALDLQSLFTKFEDAQKALAKAKKSDDKKDSKEPKRDEAIINALLAGEKPLLVNVDRASDILNVLKLKERFNVNVVLVGAADAIMVAEKIAAANVPVIVSGIDNLPHSFDSLNNALGNTKLLEDAGVKIILSEAATHNIYQLRYSAGNAVSYGLSRDTALASMTKNVAEVFSLNSGVIAKGKSADLVLWSADPFEISSKVEKLWIGGTEYSTTSRQDKLRDRYLTQSDMPEGYSK